jgi:hypothetical protein
MEITDEKIFKIALIKIVTNRICGFNSNMIMKYNII